MNTRSRRRRSRRHARRRFLLGLLVFVAVLGAAVFLASSKPDLPPPVPVPSSAATDPEASIPALADTKPERDVYPYSVIAGGAASVDELAQAIAADPVVADHYARFDLAKARVEPRSAPRLAHVSYRIGDSVFWTRKPVVLNAGEPVLTDGVHVARTRCGNQVADEPGPVSDLEPAPAVLDAPVSPVLALPIGPTARLKPAGSLSAPVPSSLTAGGGAIAPQGARGSMPFGGGGGAAGAGGGLPMKDDPQHAGSSLDAVAPPILADDVSPFGEQPFPPGGGTPPPGGQPPVSQGTPQGPPDLPGPPGPGPNYPPNVPPLQPPLLPPPVGVPPLDLPLPPTGDTPLVPDTPPEQPVPVPEPGTGLLIVQAGLAYAARKLYKRRPR